MAILKSKEIIKMSGKDMEDKLKDLKIELIKSRVANKKGGKSTTREIKRTIAKLLTIKRLNEIKAAASGEKK